MSYFVILAACAGVPTTLAITFLLARLLPRKPSPKLERKVLVFGVVGAFLLLLAGPAGLWFFVWVLKASPVLSLVLGGIAYWRFRQDADVAGGVLYWASWIILAVVGCAAAIYFLKGPIPGIISQ